jgi:hypothetical protein
MLYGSPGLDSVYALKGTSFEKVGRLVELLEFGELRSESTCELIEHKAIDRFTSYLGICPIFDKIITHKYENMTVSLIQ